MGELFSMGLGIRFLELKTVMEGYNSKILCSSFSIRLEFEDGRVVGFLGLGGWRFKLTFEFEIGF